MVDSKPFSTECDYCMQTIDNLFEQDTQLAETYSGRTVILHRNCYLAMAVKSKVTRLFAFVS